MLYLDWNGNLETGSAENFRTKILVPVLKALDDRKLTRRSTTSFTPAISPGELICSRSFPTTNSQLRVDSAASITGATYLLPYVDGQRPGDGPANVNWYVPGPPGVNDCAMRATGQREVSRFPFALSVGPDGNKPPKPRKGQRYLLSTMLGVTQGRGNTVDEVLVVSPPGRRRRRHATQRHDLLHVEQRHSQRHAR